MNDNEFLKAQSAFRRLVDRICEICGCDECVQERTERMLADLDLAYGTSEEFEQKRKRLLQ